jgi:hypothetical protein
MVAVGMWGNEPRTRWALARAECQDARLLARRGPVPISQGRVASDTRPSSARRL